MGVVEIKDYMQEKFDRITFAWEDSETFKKFLELNSVHAQALQEVFRQLYEERWIDTAVGKQLDIIGDIVGQPRELLDADLLEFFGFEGDPQSESMGSLNNPHLGGIFYTLGQKTTGNVVLDDDRYRLFIKAKIIKNTTRATPEDLTKWANFVFETKGSTVLEEEDASFLLLIGRQLTREEIGLLRYRNKEGGYESGLLPKPIGVGVRYGSYDYNQFFAFQGVPNAKGFGELDLAKFDGSFDYNGEIAGDPLLNPNVGGKLMSLHGEL
mgnify:CR=1 FL=1